MEFEWDSNKEEVNIKKHGLSFTTAAELLLKPHFLICSPCSAEVRYLAVGEMKKKVYAVVYTRRENRYRIISARMASSNEEKIYRKNCEVQST